MYISRRKCEMVLAVGKKHQPGLLGRLRGLLLGRLHRVFLWVVARGRLLGGWAWWMFLGWLFRSFHGLRPTHRKSMGALWGRSCPQGWQLFNPHCDGRVFTEPLPASFKCGKVSHFCEIHALELRRPVKFFAMLSPMRFFGRYFAPGVKHRTPRSRL